MKFADFLKQHRYELIAFLTGAAVMMLEIVGARLLAPYFGTSTYVWTAMIGVILGAMSLGFWWGGRLADRDEPGKDLGVIIAGAALMVLLMTLVQGSVLDAIADQKLDLRLSAILAAIALFGVPSFLIGMVSPHLAKIRITSLQTSGTAVGRLEAAGAIGSIGGTFFSGYVLLAYLGARNLSLWLAVLLILTSLLAGWRQFLKFRLMVAGLALLLLFYNPLPKYILSDTDSAYSRYQIQRRLYNGRLAHLLVTDRFSLQSAAYPDEPETPVFPYIAQMFAATLGYGQPDNMLVIGGGAHTFPGIIQAHMPDTAIDVVEIDSSLKQLSEEYFGFLTGPHTRLLYEDGRSFLNRNDGSYDLIFMDAFSSLTPPFHLTSRQAVERINANLDSEGAVVVNAPTAYDGEFLASMYETYGSVFRHVGIYQASVDRPLSERQNFLIVAADSEAAFDRAVLRLGPVLDAPVGGLILTDDYAPVERLSF